MHTPHTSFVRSRTLPALTRPLTGWDRRESLHFCRGVAVGPTQASVRRGENNSNVHIPTFVCCCFSLSCTFSVAQVLCWQHTQGGDRADHGHSTWGRLCCEVERKGAELARAHAQDVCCCGCAETHRVGSGTVLNGHTRLKVQPRVRPCLYLFLAFMPHNLTTADRHLSCDIISGVVNNRRGGGSPSTHSSLHRPIFPPALHLSTGPSHSFCKWTRRVGGPWLVQCLMR